MESNNITFENALKIFGYTYQEYLKLSEEDIKKKYRRETFKCHPDRYPGDENKTRQMQEINMAYEILKKHKNNQSKKETTFNFYVYMEEEIKKLEKILNEEGHNTRLTDYVMLRNEIQKIIHELETDSIYFKSKIQFDREYRETKRQIKFEMEKFKIDFYKNNYIDEQEVKIILDYNSDILSFYNQLLSIKSKYSKEEKAKRKIVEEVEEYKSYLGYEKVKMLIDICIQNTLSNIRNNNFQNIQEDINQMHQQIRYKIFEKYYELKEKITKLEATICGINDQSIEEEYLKICKNFEEGKSFFDIENMIENIEKNIADYHEREIKKQNQKEKEDIITKIYQSLITKYSEVLKTYNLITQMKEIKEIETKLDKILEIFVRGFINEMEKEFFTPLEDITFTDETNDKEIIDKALKKLNQNKNNVYIKREGDIKFDQSCFFYYDKESMKIYKVDKTVSHATVITKEELEKEYISLEEVLESSQKINEFKKLGNELVRGIYKSKTHIIYFCKNQFNITTNSIFNKFEKTSFYDAIEIFDDKQQVLEMINKQIKRKVDEYKKTTIHQNVKFPHFPQTHTPSINDIKYPKYEKNYFQDTYIEKEEFIKRKYIK